MGRPAKSEPPDLLTPAESEIMTALWDHGEGTVHDVRQHLGTERAYTTVSTLLRILEQKGFVHSRPSGRQHIYSPSKDRRETELVHLRDLARRFFGGDANAVVRTLVDAGEVSAEQLEALRRRLERT